MIDAAFRRELARAVGPGGLLSDPADLLTYESDALAHLRAIPGAVVLPASAAEVQAVVRLCHRSRVPFVARGHGTGLSGGALPHPDGVLIGLSRLNRILDVDHPEPARHRRTRRDEPGDHETRRGGRLLLRARPVEPGRLLDRRQHRRELRRRALPQVRLHGPSRARRRGGAARRRARARSAGRRWIRRGSICWRRSSDPKARSPS